MRTTLRQLARRRLGIRSLRSAARYVPLAVSLCSLLLLLQLALAASGRWQGPGADRRADRDGFSVPAVEERGLAGGGLDGREVLEPSAGPEGGTGVGSGAEPGTAQATHGSSPAAPGTEAGEGTAVGPAAAPVPADLAALRDVVEEVRVEKQRLERARAELDLQQRGVLALIREAEAKLGRMEELAGRLEELLDRVGEDEESRLQGLVALYQAMKPKQAARIFDRLEMPVLLRLARRMRETKLAPIVAAMDPQRARELTTELSAAPDIPRLE